MVLNNPFMGNRVLVPDCVEAHWSRACLPLSDSW